MNNRNPFKNSDTNKRYFTYDYYLRQKFGKKCFKVTLDGGFTCPNRDGSKGTGGCTFCSMSDRSDIPSITEQFERNRDALLNKWHDALYIPYFQVCTNTYAPLAKLRELYETALSFPDCVGINIATRADTLEDDTVAYLRELSERTFLTVEIGLQSVHDETAARINRCHTYAEFLDGYGKLDGLNVCVHIINGLPLESKEMMLETAREVAKLHPAGVKIHLLHILRETKLAEQYANGEFETMTLEDYTDTVCSQIELLPDDIYIGRVTGDGLKDELVAPLWSLKKFVVMNEIDKTLVRRGTYQGIFSQYNICKFKP